MLTKLVIVFLSLWTIVESNDLMVGHATPFSKKIFSAIKEANPALWTRRDDIVINAPYHDFISAVYVSDLRPDKDGESYIEAGGIGFNTVTLALKSPSILRGYKFAIDVYAESIHSYAAGNIRTPLSGLSGVAAYPSTYPVGSASYYDGRATYPIGNVQYPAATYPQVNYGR